MALIDRVIIDNKPHNMAREAVPVYDFFKRLECVEHLGIGAFREIGTRNQPLVIPKYYDADTRTYRIVVEIKCASQVIFVKVKNGRLKEFQERTSEYVLDLITRCN